MTRAAAVLIATVSALSLSISPLAASQEPAKPPASAKPLTVEAIYAHGPLIGHPPDELAWSPDGKHLTYLDGGELVDMDPASGQAHVLVSRAKLASLAGAMPSERDRDHRERYKMASYQWAPDSAHLLFDQNGRLWLFDLHNGTGVEIGFTGMASGDDPKFSPNGEFISFIRDHGLAVVQLKYPGQPAIAVAPGKEAILNGEVDWVYEEELDDAQQHLLVAGLEEAGLSADERDQRAALSDYRLASHPRPGVCAELSAARRSQSRGPRRRGRRARRQDGVGEAADSGR